MKTVKGDLIMMALAGDFDIIAHGCNCFHTMGSGIAAGIRRTWPEAFTADIEQTSSGDRGKLGTYSNFYDSALRLSILNMYTQYRWSRKGPDGKLDPQNKAVDYMAIRNCMLKLKEDVQLTAKLYNNARIGLPKIGCGLAGGDWELVETIISEELDGLDVTIVEYYN